MQRRRKRAHIDIQVYEDWELNGLSGSTSTLPLPPPDVSTSHRHIDYVTRKNGISTRRSYYRTEPLATSSAHDDDNNVTHDDAYEGPSTYDETTGLYRIEPDEEDDGELIHAPRTTRKRTLAGVRLFCRSPEVKG